MTDERSRREKMKMTEQEAFEEKLPSGAEPLGGSEGSGGRNSEESRRKMRGGRVSRLSNGEASGFNNRGYHISLLQLLYRSEGTVAPRNSGLLKR